MTYRCTPPSLTISSCLKQILSNIKWCIHHHTSENTHIIIDRVAGRYYIWLCLFVIHLWSSLRQCQAADVVYSEHGWHNSVSLVYKNIFIRDYTKDNVLKGVDSNYENLMTHPLCKPSSLYTTVVHQLSFFNFERFQSIKKATVLIYTYVCYAFH